MTPDGFPFFGWAPEVSNFLLGVGLCGQGFMLGPSGGELLARLAQGVPTESDKMILKYVSPDRKFVGQELLK